MEFSYIPNTVGMRTSLKQDKKIQQIGMKKHENKENKKTGHRIKQSQGCFGDQN